MLSDEIRSAFPLCLTYFIKACGDIMTKPVYGSPSLAPLSCSNNFTGKIVDRKIDASLTDVTPEASARLIVAKFRASTSSVIEGCALTAEAIAKYSHDKKALAAFCQVLADESIIDRAFKPDGKLAAKLSMLQTIGRHVDLLSNPRVNRHLDGGYSVLYQAVKLFDAVGRNEAAFVALLEKHGGRLSREDVISQKKVAKARARESQAIAAAQKTTATSIIEARELKDFLLLTPSREDIRRISANYVDDTLVPQRLRLHEVVSENGVAAVVVRLSQLPVVLDKLLPYCGFDKPCRVFLADQPKTRDITDAIVIVTAEKRAGAFAAEQHEEWASDGNDLLDPIRFAESLLPDAKHKLRVFAREHVAGWDCILSEDCWDDGSLAGERAL